MQEIDQMAIDRPPSSASKAKRIKAEEGISHRFERAVQRYKETVSLKAPAAGFGFLFHIAVDMRAHFLQRLMTPQTTLEAVSNTCHFERYHRIFLAGLRVTCAAAITQLTTAELQGILSQAVEAMCQALFEGLPWQIGYGMNIPISGVQDWAAL